MISHRPAKKNFNSMGLFSKYKPRSNIFMDLNPTGIKKPSRPYYVNQFVSDSVEVSVEFNAKSLRPSILSGLFEN